MSTAGRPQPRAASTPPLAAILALDPAAWMDPVAAGTGLREAGPVHWSDAFFGGAWVVSRHADVDHVLRDKAYSARRTGAWLHPEGDAPDSSTDAPPPGATAPGFESLFARAMLFVDAPDHRRLRALMQAGFTPAAMQALRPWVESHSAALLDAVHSRAAADPHPVDLIAHLARPLPVAVMAQVLGLDSESSSDAAGSDRLGEWSDALSGFLGSPYPDALQTARARVGLQAMAGHFARLIAARRDAPGPGLLGRLIEAHAQGRIESLAELLAQCVMLLFAGHETTRHLIGNLVHTLWRDPALLARLRAEPACRSAAVREVLRLHSPVQYSGRRVAATHTLHGQTLRRGDAVVALIGAANRDARQHADAHAIDLGRRITPPLAFGTGAHVCIGAALTLMEAEVVLDQLLQRAPTLRLAQPDAPAWLPGPTLYRGLQSLPVWVA